MIIMSDRDKAQMNAVTGAFLESTLSVVLVACAPRHADAFLYGRISGSVELSREWVRASDQLKFDSLWEEMQADPVVPIALWAISR